MTQARFDEPQTPERLVQHPVALKAYRASFSHPEALHEHPSSDELGNYWNNFYNNFDMVSVPGVLGTVRKLKSSERPNSFVSLDVCEIVRETCYDLAKISSNPDPDRTAVGYTYGSELGISAETDKLYPNEQLILRIVQGRMSSDLVGPEHGIDEMRAILQNMRNNGAYIIANTSTLPGCEPATMRFFKKHLKDSVDGILLPRNHHGDSEFTKGNSFVTALDFISDTNRLPVKQTLAIDDTAHHIHAIRKEIQLLPQASHFDVAPITPWNRDDRDIRHFGSSLLAMLAMQETHNQRRSL